MFWFLLGVVVGVVGFRIVDVNGHIVRKMIKDMEVGDLAEVRKGSDGIVSTSIRRLVEQRLVENAEVSQ